VSPESDTLRERLEALEREHTEQIARTHEAVAAAQDRAYWLDRWNVDLNALMRKRGARELRWAVRAARSVVRLLRKARAGASTIPGRAAAARSEVDEAPPPEPEARHERFTRSIPPDLLEAAPVAEILFGRLREDDLSAVQARLDPEEASGLERAGSADRKRMMLAYAAHYGVQPALERTGLSAAMPGPGVHSMSQGPLAAGGVAYYADLVVDALRQSGFEPAAGQAALDFGSSSGRVVRVLAAAYPQLDWHGCDPIPEAIDWARENLPGVTFRRSPERPPLDYEESRFDFVFAISIWSHFAERAALAWLAEMRRVVRPGGRLLLTTHGEQAITAYHGWGIRPEAQLEEIQAALHRDGFWYAPEFGDAGDHGVVNPDWGTAFLTPEWLAAAVTPDWSVSLFRPGRVEGNQDLYVLARR
jgi:SAM-dependent methyltransferase